MGPVGPPPEADAPDELAEAPREAAPVRRFEFAHKVFHVEDGVFLIDEASEAPVYSVDLGDVRATLTFGTLCASFGIEPGSPDALLLEDVRRALAFVRRVRHGDSIPSELLDGSASWSVDERHREIARGRVWIGLVAWLSGGKAASGVSIDEFARIANSPEARARVQGSLGVLADQLGYPPEKRADVVDRIERLIDELAYVEALRERVGLARRIVETLRGYRVAFKRERTLTEEVERTMLLAERPVAGHEKRLADLDARTAETLETLRRLDAQIEQIRRTRDALHAGMMKWDGMLAVWADAPALPGPDTHRLIRNTYRFAARHFPVQQEWKR
ncbi:MAG: hypothetical protein JNL71_04795 [Rhodospirillales bacterium]|nr:hypothetical protein [Rhodospirillales bacterium]